jgi:hypothetical protein
MKIQEEAGGGGGNKANGTEINIKDGSLRNSACYINVPKVTVILHRNIPFK